jgi:hypothetical protein
VKRVLLAALAASLATGPVFAEDFSRIGIHRNNRAFWLHGPFPERQVWDSKPAPAKFTKTYTDGVVRRLGLGNGGHLDVFDGRIGGRGGPAIAGTIDGGAAKLVLRWHPGED